MNMMTIQIKKHNIKYKSTLGHKTLDKYGENKMIDKEDNEMAKDVEVTIKGVKLELWDEEKIKKIRFDTDRGDITWKPKATASKIVGGFVIETSEPMRYSEIPPKLADIGKKCQENGSCKVKLTYFVFKKEVDGEEMTYRYINSIKVFEKWEIL